MSMWSFCTDYILKVVIIAKAKSVKLACVDICVFMKSQNSTFILHLLFTARKECVRSQLEGE